MKQAICSHDLVSVIVPIYNVAPYLIRCLDSIANQTYHNLEVLLIDDGSTDDSGQIAMEYADCHPKFQVIQQKNQGLSGARNTGIMHATGEWLYFVDSDDEILPDTITLLLHAAKHAHLKMSMGGFTICRTKGHKTTKSYTGITPGIFSGKELFYYFLVTEPSKEFVWNKLFHHSLFETIRFPVGKVYEDIFVLPSLLDTANACVMINQPVYNYYLRKGSITAKPDISRQMHALEARFAQKDFIKKRYPELAPYVCDLILIVCTWLFGKIEKSGKKEHIKEWEFLCDTFRKERKEAAKKRPLLRLILPIFSMSPALYSKLYYLYSRFFC